MKIRITGRGIWGRDGELTVGSEHEISSTIPAGWLEKVVVIDDAPEDAEPITNDLTREVIAEMEKAEVLEWLDAHGWDGDKRLGVEKLRESLAEIVFIEA